jgi:hypothetical protein
VNNINMAAVRTFEDVDILNSLESYSGIQRDSREIYVFKDRPDVSFLRDLFRSTNEC